MKKLAFLCAVTLTFGAAPMDDDALYMERYQRAEAARKSGSLGSIYDVMAPLRSADPLVPLQAKSGPSPISADVIDEAAAYVAPRKTSAFLILHEGEIVHESYYGDTKKETPLVAKSLAKPLSVIAVGRAIKEGHIKSLDQPASDFFIEWKGTPKETISVRHLLTMRSGLKRQSPYTGPEDVMRKAYLHPRHIEIILAYYPLIHPPGTRYEYANVNGELIAPLIERATGEHYEDWVSDQILQPLGAQGGEIWLNRVGGTAHSGCCSTLPAHSWVTLALLVMQDGVWEGARLLPEGYTKQMRTPTAENPFVGMGVYNGARYAEYRGAQNPDYGGGTYHSAPYTASDIILFDGNGNQVIYMLPSQNLIIARFGSWPDKALGWDNAFLPNLISPTQ